MFASFAKKLVDTAGQLSNTLNQPSDASDPYFKGFTQGLRVLSVSADAQFESWFDYIVGVNGHNLLYIQTSNGFAIDHQVFFEELSRGAGSVTVWSAKGGVVRTVTLHVDAVEQALSLREIPITPTNPETSEDPYNQSVISQTLFEKLGLKLQLQPLAAATYVWRVLSVQPDTNAEKLGLIPMSDYIMAVGNDGLLCTGGETLLSKVMTSYYSKYNSQFHYDQSHRPQKTAMDDLVLYVYNHDYDVVRPVNINFPTLTSNGALPEFRLGCDVGYGYLHRVPEVFGKWDSAVQSQSGSDVLFESASPVPEPLPVSNPADLITPAMLASQTQHPRTKKKSRAPGNTYGANYEFNDYLNEELDKSRKMDEQYSGANTGSVPPPPPPPARE
ncbi:hypothetical protein BABINDRAFT_10646 [Babjeviella inositovora NRRL Y-12698]|uniref:PDZ GRASP-type domain-containing protein n=1 Tax=Babjeviella inositovora NRRL Y-12698 TaxID=984486 RepID=A0A1E3QYK5_9ASCO|nr:uncharacterized protein BABINDRAFT_10646 [Babjeviella inositovora NRRL Y-12698]ODQ82167.1 hypothetical protein BABINDRAFT_10646 [Babjeviella inositovora NRRL Y-12698]